MAAAGGVAGAGAGVGVRVGVREASGSISGSFVFGGDRKDDEGAASDEGGMIDGDGADICVVSVVVVEDITGD